MTSPADGPVSEGRRATDQDRGTAASVPPASRVRSDLSDGEWHRLHPLTPLLRGGLFLVVVIGIVIANLRDRLIAVFVPGMRGSAEMQEYEADPVAYLIDNDLLVVGGLGLLGALVVLTVLFWLSWRFHTFRITGDHVEVRSGVVFRSHRRAPLDRVQGVNLTRPMLARIFGMAKLEVVGAGLDANVKLEYLSTTNAETIRGDILRLASGRQLAEADAKAKSGVPRSRAAAATVTAGLTGLIDGEDEETTEPESVVRIPTGRVIAAHLLSGSTVWLLLLIVGVVIGSVLGTPLVLVSLIPTILGFGAYWFRQITRSLRYAIAPTAAGVRVTFGLLTTITETVPPGRVHAFEISQPLLWRRLGWWRIRINRISGRSLSDAAAATATDVLPVGSREDVDRVMRLFLPGLPDAAWAEVFVHGLVQRPYTDDPYTTTPRRARWLRPLSWRRNGYLLADAALLLRHGVLRRALVILPLARLQSIRVSQGPIDRALHVANITGHTVVGPVSGALGIIDRDAALTLWHAAAARTVTAAADDRSHRWDAAPDRIGPGGPESGTGTADAPVGDEIADGSTPRKEP